MNNSTNTSDKFNLFYAQAILNDKQIPPVNEIETIFEDLTLDEFISIMRRILNNNDGDTFRLFLYYIMLFRRMEHLQQYINSNNFDIDLLENLVMFAFGYCTLWGYTTERILDEIFYFLSNKRLLELTLTSKYISRDKGLLFYMLTKLDTDSLNRYFSQCRNASEILQYFSKLPNEVMKSIIARSYHLFQYIMIMMAEDESAQIYIKDFYDKYKTEIEQLSRLNDIIKEYKDKADLEKERNLPFQKRNMDRITFLVNKIREMPDSQKAVEYFSGENMFADDQEKLIVKAIVCDPLFKDTFHYYDQMFLK